MQNCSVIAKGSYSNFKFNDFVSVRQYLLIRENGQKYLIMKLSNDASEPVTGLKLAVEQLDVRGNRIEVSHVEWTNVKGGANEKFIPQDKIPLKEECVEVKIRLIGAAYGNYNYEVKSNELIVTYEKESKLVKKDYSHRTDGKRSVLNERKFKIPRAIVVMTFFVLICVIAATVLQLFTFKKEESEFLLKGVKYEFISDDREEGSAVRVIGCSSLGENIVIPEEIEGYPVKEIAENAFLDNDKIRSIKILADVSIANCAFYDCDKLESVTLIKTSKIGTSAFQGCKQLRSVTAMNLSTIGELAFKDCSSLETVEFSNDEKVLTIGRKAFADCSSLKVVRLLQKIAYPSTMDFFYGVHSLKELSLKHYNSAQFEAKTNKTLAELFGGRVQTYLHTLTIEDIDEIPREFCRSFTALETVTLNGLKKTEIKEKAFEGCKNLENFNATFKEKGKSFTKVGGYAFYKTRIPAFDGSKLEVIGESAFAENKSLTDVKLNENQVLSSLGISAFEGCLSLETAHVPATVTVLNRSVFENCNNLTTVSFAETSRLTAIDERAFFNCRKLSYIQMPHTVLSIGDMAYEGCLEAVSAVFSRTLQTIGENAFKGCSALTEAELPSTVTEIGFGAFSGCKNIEALSVPFVGCTRSENSFLAALFGGSSYEDYSVVPKSLKTVTVLGDGNLSTGAFYCLRSLKKVELIGEVERIENYAFAFCSNLREIRLSEALAYVSEGAFMDCYTLFEVWNESSLAITRGSVEYGGVGRYALVVYGKNDVRVDNKAQDGFFFLKASEGWYVTDYVGEGSEWTLPVSFVDGRGYTVSQYAMPAHVFEGRMEVENLHISSALKKMGEYAFSFCPNLASITFFGNVACETIAPFAFYGCLNLKTVDAPKSASITAIKEGAFEKCTLLESISLPSAIVSIGDYAFRDCYSLTELSLPTHLQTIGEYAFYCCTRIEELSLPQSVTEIGFGAFGSMQSLETLSVPFIGGSLTENQYMAYVFAGYEDSGNTSLKQIEITSMGTSNKVPDFAFYSFYALTDVIVTDTVNAIGDYAFAHCSNLKDFTYEGKVENVGKYAFFYSGIDAFDFSCVTAIGDYAFQNSSLKNVVFPSTLTQLGMGAFYESGVQSVNLQNAILVRIPDFAFYNCQSLETCLMPKGYIQEIGYGAFSYTALTEAVLPQSIRKIESLAFGDCENLAVVSLGQNLYTIEYDAFYNCANLHEIYNLSALPIQRGDWNYGQVAYNAVIVHTSATANPLATEMIDGMTYKYASTEKQACLFACESIPESLQFKAVTLGGKRYDNYWIWRGVFSDNDTLKELDTGVVTEISSWAFANNMALRKVTVNSALKAGKVAYDAFSSCMNLWEVHDKNANYNILKGSGDCGNVAYYALAVNETIEYSTEGDFEFMKYGGKWYMYECLLSGNIKLPQRNEKYVLFKHPNQYDYNPLPNVSWGDYIIVPKSVSAIDSGALGYNYVIVYYEGTQTQWSNITSNQNYYNLSIYYFNNCVHNTYQGTSYWCYVNDEPSTENSALIEKTTQEATCQNVGLNTYTCETCKKDIYTEQTSRVSHEHDKTTGACKWCKQVLLKDGDLGELLTVGNNSSYKFMIDKNGTVYSDWRDDYSYISSTLTLKAKEDLTLSFTIRLSSVYASVKIILNGTTAYTLNGNETKEIVLELRKNENVKIKIEMSINTQTESRVYVEKVKVEAKNKPQGQGE